MPVLDQSQFMIQALQWAVPLVKHSDFALEALRWSLRATNFKGSGAPLYPATLGSGPIDEAVFDSLLREFGIEPQQTTENTEVLVIGYSLWDPSKLNDLLDSRTGETLRVYSQELYIEYLLSSEDPFDQSEDILREKGRGHPALEYLMGVGFAWPTTLVTASRDPLRAIPSPTLGYLRYLGYRVGRQAPPQYERLLLLLHAFSQGVVPPVFDPEYVAQWSEPNTPQRLSKLAESLAAFCRNERRKARPSTLAIQHWESDLQWLHENVYKGRFRFQWPSTHVY
jgi:hypothetical protein